MLYDTCQAENTDRETHEPRAVLREIKLQSVGHCSNDGRPVCELAHRDRDFSAPDSRRRAKKWWLSAPGNRQAGSRGVPSTLWCAFRGIDRHAARVETSDTLNQLSIQT